MAAKLGFEIVKQAMLKLLMKKGDDGIVLTLPKNEILDLNTRITMDRLIRNNIDPNSLTSPDQVINVLDNIDNQTINKAVSADSEQGRKITEMLFGKKGEVVDMTGKKIDTSQGIMGGKSVKELMESGQVQKGTDDIKISEKITDRDMFKGANKRFNETENFVTNTITKIKGMEPMDAMKEANSVIGRKGRYKNLTPEQSKKILQDTEDHIFERDIPIDPEDMAKGGRAGYYTGGITDVEPSLDDIGHGADALNARTRLMSPGAQATTSTGLNYLLAEDNDNMRIPFAKGKIAKEVLNKGRRGFMKAAGAASAGIAALKTGLLGFGEKAAPIVEKVAETVSETAGSTYPPPYFFKLVEKIKFMGDDVTVGSSTMPRTKVTRYKDYELTEDLASGSQEIKKMGIEDDMITKNEYMTYTKGQADETTKGKKPPDNYEEVTESNSRIIKDEFNDPDYEDGIELKEILEEVGDPDSLTLKKADGGRIGFAAGKLAQVSARKFLEKVFGKEKFSTIIDNDPELEQGMLEVVDMFRNKDKEGLKMYLQKYLPHMDDAEIEDFIVGSGDSAGIGGQLIRLGSGRDYQGKIEMIEKANNMRKLENFDVEGVSKNAEGGRIGLFLGGGLTAGKGLLRTLLKFMAKDGSHKKSPSEVLQLVNPKQLDKYLNDPALMGKVSPEAPAGIPEIINAKKKEMTADRSNMVGDLIGTARRIKKVDDDIVNYKETIINDMIGRGIDRETAVEIAENLAEMVAKNAGKKNTPKITEQGLLEAENIQKNLLTKDRKLQAQGGLTTMLGE